MSFQQMSHPLQLAQTKTMSNGAARNSSDASEKLGGRASKTSEERKLFVGMLGKQQNEEDIRDLFQVSLSNRRRIAFPVNFGEKSLPYNWNIFPQGFGSIEECTILRGPDGHSKVSCG